MLPSVISEALAKVSADIHQAAPVCDGSDHWIVQFSTSVLIKHVPGASSLQFLRRGENGRHLYRAHFVPAAAGLTPEQ